MKTLLIVLTLGTISMIIASGGDVPKTAWIVLVLGTISALIAKTL